MLTSTDLKTVADVLTENMQGNTEMRALSGCQSVQLVLLAVAIKQAAQPAAVPAPASCPV